MRQPTFIRLLNCSEPTQDGCWNWRKYIDAWGYGVTHVGNKSILAHRLSYEQFKGPIADGLCVCHTCDNPRCINPDHLWLGTHKENMQDCERKGRTRKQQAHYA